MSARLRRVARSFEDRGASAVEYGLMVAAIAAVVVAAVFGMGTLVKQAFDRTCSTMAVGPASLGDPLADCGADPASGADSGVQPGPPPVPAGG